MAVMRLMLSLIFAALMYVLGTNIGLMGANRVWPKKDPAGKT